jgi:hypothetical protein
MAAGVPSIESAVNINMDLRWDGVVYTGLIQLRIGTNGGLL